MAGTDRSNEPTRDFEAEPGPVVILVRPQLAENVGMVARAMLNCALIDLRLVAPREDWLSDKAVAASSGAARVLERAVRFETVEEAIADLQTVYATTARKRDMAKPVQTPRAVVQDIMASIRAEEAVGILFGPERAGLENPDIALCDEIIEAPLNPVYASLNLAQAVLLVGHVWFEAAHAAEVLAQGADRAPPASKEELLNLFRHLEDELDACGFLRVAEKRPGMVNNIRTMLSRAQLNSQEVNTFHGIISELRHGRRPDRKVWTGQGKDQES